MHKIKLKRIVTFGFVGCLATIVHLISAYIVLLLTQNAIASMLLGFIPAFVFSYLGHRFLTFSDATSGSPIRFFIVAFSGLIFSLFVLSALDDTHSWLGLTFSICVIPLWTYVMSHLWVFSFGHKQNEIE
jgi:putative flippase GtrA